MQAFQRTFTMVQSRVVMRAAVQQPALFQFSNYLFRDAPPVGEEVSKTRE